MIRVITRRPEHRFLIQLLRAAGAALGPVNLPRLRNPITRGLGKAPRCVIGMRESGILHEIKPLRFYLRLGFRRSVAREMQRRAAEHVGHLNPLYRS